MYPRLETDRLVIRLPHFHEAAQLALYYSHNDKHFSPWEPQKEENYYSVESILARIPFFLDTYHDKRAVHFFIYNSDESEIVGHCHFTNIIMGSFQACHLGYAIAQVHEGKGLMHESLNAGISYMFEKFELHRIMANYMPSNKRSENLLSKLGFLKEGYAKSYLKIAGKWEDHILTSLINPVQV
jgi:ribosomal-protein-alanine N-acetyltransferase